MLTLTLCFRTVILNLFRCDAQNIGVLQLLQHVSYSNYIEICYPYDLATPLNNFTTPMGVQITRLRTTVLDHFLFKLKLAELPKCQKCLSSMICLHFHMCILHKLFCMKITYWSIYLFLGLQWRMYLQNVDTYKSASQCKPMSALRLDYCYYSYGLPCDFFLYDIPVNQISSAILMYCERWMCKDSM